MGKRLGMGGGVEKGQHCRRSWGRMREDGGALRGVVRDDATVGPG